MNTGGYINQKDFIEIRNNDLLVAKNGRKPDLFISKNNIQVPLKEIAIKVLDEMSKIASVMGYDADFIDHYKLQALNPDLTTSGRIMKKVLKGSVDLDEFGYMIAEKHKKHFVKRPIENNQNLKKIQREVRRSINTKTDIDSESLVSFDKYLEEYYQN